ncbi:MAG: TIGR01212 family radical SAM protein, partial [Candidatus Coatesbacteria bacterium]|nr:TIGR01212 family radical SAM protein [Candidatus Coatesbacteria bacterium]
MEKIFTFGDYCKNKFGRRIPKIVFDISSDSNKSCKHRELTGGCSYCLPESFEVESYKGTLKEQKNHALKNRDLKDIRFWSYLQHGTPTAIDEKILFSSCKELLEDDQSVGLIIASRPDTLKSSFLEFLKDLGSQKEIWIEVGLQSSHDETLKKINRGYNFACFVECMEKIASYRKFRTGVHLIIGLPDETVELILETVNKINYLPVDGVKFHQLQIVKGTNLAGEYNKNPWRLMDWMEYADIIIKSIRLLKETKIILRMVARTKKDFLIAPQWDMNNQDIIKYIR